MAGGGRVQYHAGSPALLYLLHCAVKTRADNLGATHTHWVVKPVGDKNQKEKKDKKKRQQKTAKIIRFSLEMDP